MSFLSMIRILIYAVVLGVGLLVTGMMGSVAWGYVKVEETKGEAAVAQDQHVEPERNVSAVGVDGAPAAPAAITQPQSSTVEITKATIVSPRLLALEEVDRRIALKAITRPLAVQERHIWEREERPADHLASLYAPIAAALPLGPLQINFGPSTITRMAIPAIKLDRSVAQVNIEQVEIAGKWEPRWEVLPYDVGHHADTANPGQGGNIVLTGHSGGARYPFNELGWLVPGQSILLWSHGEKYSYAIDSVNIVAEEGPQVTLEQRQKNAEYILPTPSEMITMVTCWPLSDTPQAKKFTQRVIVRALPTTK